jgi:hypothetical protein
MHEMKNAARIIELNGGYSKLADRPIRIEMKGYDRLCIEHVGNAPTDGLVLVSVAHYFEQNGDLMSDPEMTFEVNPSDDKENGWLSGSWRPASITQSPMGVYREAVFRDDAGRTLIRPKLVAELKGFARMWNRNIGEQGYLEAFRRQLAETSDGVIPARE